MLINSLNVEWVSNHRKRNRAWFEIYKKIDDLCHRVRTQLKCAKNDKPRFFVDTLYLRSLSLFESVCILAEQGLVVESMILSRSLLETCFALVAAVRDKTFAEECLSRSGASELKLMKCSRQHLAGHVPAELVQKLDTRRRELELACGDAEPFKIVEISRRADLQDRYDTDYRALCRNTHFSEHNLDRHLVVDEQGDVAGFRWGPSDDNFELSMICSADTMMLIVRTMCLYHNLDESEEWGRIAADLVRFGKAGQALPELPR